MALKLSYHLMDADEVRRTLDTVADQIIAANTGKQIVLLGIQRRGVPMAQRMAKYIEAKTGKSPEIGILDINLYRDDLTKVATQPVVRETDIPPDIDDKDGILVDDVLYTGRTTAAALRALIDFGRMHTIQLAVFVDRGHPELPIEANFIGKKLKTRSNEVVEVRLKEIDGEDAIHVMENT